MERMRWCSEYFGLFVFGSRKIERSAVFPRRLARQFEQREWLDHRLSHRRIDRLLGDLAGLAFSSI